MKITRSQLRSLIYEVVSLEKDPDNPFTEKFTNELDNEIELSIKEVDGDTPGSMMITMVGPTSTMENIITRMEAERLHAMLMRYLKPDKGIQ